MTNRQRALQPWWDWSQTGQTADSTDLPLWCEDGDSEPDNLFWVLLFLYLSEALISKLDEVKNNQHTTQFDVKIGAGMDIAIHGENGQSDSTNQTKHESNFPTLSNPSPTPDGSPSSPENDVLIFSSRIQLVIQFFLMSMAGSWRPHDGRGGNFRNSTLQYATVPLNSSWVKLSKFLPLQSCGPGLPCLLMRIEGREGDGGG